jgi:hypothetical protein
VGAAVVTRRTLLEERDCIGKEMAAQRLLVAVRTQSKEIANRRFLTVWCVLIFKKINNIPSLIVTDLLKLYVSTNHQENFQENFIANTT